jgi:DNA-directed RNA polymerase beta subunit
MYSLPKNVYRERKDFSKIKTTVPIPNLIEIQRKSYERFLQMNRLPSEREDAGLQSVFKSVFPISDFRENSSLEFIEYSIGNWECKCGKLSGLHHLRKPCKNCGATLVADPYGDHEVLCPRCGVANQARGDVCDICGHTVGMKLKYDVDECQERGMTYAVPLKVTIRLVVWNKDPETGVKTIRDIKEQEVYFGDIPLMTDNGTFIINGTERVIVSQLHRSPGAFFHSEDKTLYVAQIIPYRGSWVEFEYDQKNLLYVRIDRKRKFLATVFLRALGLRGADEIIRTFYAVDRVFLNQGQSLMWAVNDSLVGLRAAADVKAGDFSVQSGKKISTNAIAALRKAGIESIPVADEALEGAFAAADIVDPETGEVILEANEELTPRVISMAQEKRVEKIEIFFPERDEVGPYHQPDAEKGSDPHARGSADRNLSSAAARRSADARQLAVALREHVLQPAEVRLLAGWPSEAEHQARAEDAARREDPASAGLLRSHQVSAEAAEEPAERGRHRSSRQPARALGRRAAREPVPHRPGAHGARDQGKDVGLPGNGDRHAARPDQREAGDGRDSRVLRLVAAVAVHGPDQSAVRDHAQTPALGARTRRAVSRASWIRSTRRPSDALRAHLPD